jgi:anti-sigma regulatory factor (Ser/Thr protein kinase)
MEVAMTSGIMTAWRPARGGPGSIRIPVGDLSRVGEARRAADGLARGCGLDEERRAVVGIVVTEAATNLAKHARGGYVLLRDTSSQGVAGVEMLSVDCGPGMANLSQFFTDGYSTSGTAGQGLGAIRRQASELDVHSVPGQGTVFVARVFATADARRADDPPRDALVDIGVVCLPFDGETACGDGWCVVQDARRAAVLLVDGLGHGPNAAQAADVAIETFRTVSARAPVEAVGVVHEALRATRGAAIAVAEVVRGDEGAAVSFCAVGNTVSAIVGSGKPRSLASMNGTAGLQVGRLQGFTQGWPTGALMVMHTDGITSRWRLESYPGLVGRDPSIVAAVLQRDFTRPRDDATVLVLALRAPGAP